MTENEYTNEQLIDFMYDVMDWRDVVDHPMIYAVIEELKEIQQYRAIGTPTQIYEKIGGLDVELGKYYAIGTIEEFKALKEKSVAKKPEVDEFDYGEGFVCGECESFLHYVDDDDEHIRTNYCCHCGTRIDWSE